MVSPGRTVAIVGRSGSGKTTLVKCLSGLLEPTEGVVLFDGVDVGRHCRIRRAIIDKNVRVPAGTVIGYDAAADRRRFVVSPSGIVIIPKEQVQLRLREMNR